MCQRSLGKPIITTKSSHHRVAKEAIMRKLAEFGLERLERRAEGPRDVLEKLDVQRVVAHMREERESR